MVQLHKDGGVCAPWAFPHNRQLYTHLVQHPVCIVVHQIPWETHKQHLSSRAFSPPVVSRNSYSEVLLLPAVEVKFTFIAFSTYASCPTTNDMWLPESCSEENVVLRFKNFAQSCIRIYAVARALPPAFIYFAYCILDANPDFIKDTGNIDFPHP